MNKGTNKDDMTTVDILISVITNQASEILQQQAATLEKDVISSPAAEEVSTQFEQMFCDKKFEDDCPLAALMNDGHELQKAVEALQEDKKKTSEE